MIVENGVYIFAWQPMSEHTDAAIEEEEEEEEEEAEEQEENILAHKINQQFISRTDLFSGPCFFDNINLKKILFLNLEKSCRSKE